MIEIERGSIYRLNSGGERGREIYGDRPVVVVSSKITMQLYGVATIIPLSTTLRGGEYHVIIKSSKYASIAMCEHIRTVDTSRLSDKYGNVTEIELKRIEEAIAFTTGVVKATEIQEKASGKEMINKMIVELDTYKKMYNNLLDRLSGKRE